MSLRKCLMLIVLLPGCGIGVSSSSSSKTVEIPQTPIEDQKKVGFCWAYAGVGLVESDYKFRSGEEINLSEEALGFYRMAEGLHYLTQNVSGQDLLDAITQEEMEGWLLSSDEVPDTFDLIQKYGVVPESVWNFKFENSLSKQFLINKIKTALKKLVFYSANPKEITIEDIINKALLAPGAWPSRPPLEFTYLQKKYTPTEFLTELGFDASSYEALNVSEKKDVEALIAATKRALVRGVSVPLGYPVHFDRLNLDTFSGKGVDTNVGDNFFRDGGHAVLIDDFVNEGGKEGALPYAIALAEFLKEPSSLSYFLFKNSWGKNAKTNEAGVVISGSETGYYKIDRAYLEGAASFVIENEVPSLLEIIVPKDIKADPFGFETVNAKVTQQTN